MSRYIQNLPPGVLLGGIDEDPEVQYEREIVRAEALADMAREDEMLRRWDAHEARRERV